MPRSPLNLTHTLARSAPLSLMVAAAIAAPQAALAQTTPVQPIVERPTLGPLETLNVAGYLGTWHQIALYPNRFQKQCVAETSATYAQRPDGMLSVTNRCRNAKGEFEDIQGVARPRSGAVLRDGTLIPASLEVSFLPAWLRWMPVGWGDYDVVHRMQGGEVSIVSEPSREYLWVLSRNRPMSAAAWAEAQAWLKAAGFDLNRLQVDSEAVAR